MIFKIPEQEINENVINLMKRVGYFSLGRGREESELSFVRSIRSDNYPRFHVIVRSDAGKEIVFNIHLDQRKPVHKGAVAHNADYDGPIIEEEIERIKSYL